ncbi:MAG: hypothetical protein KGN36_03195, partial [Acidobacteriota bacterium]|nr:hypothetical protein [Acidobacteriota bacterium]
PGMGNVDMRISRDFTITERVKLSLLGEAFNVFNHTNVYSVNSLQYTYSGAGSGACSGHSNGCFLPVSSFLTPSATNNNLYGARQLQLSGRITF